MNSNDVALIEEAHNTFIGRLFTLGGSVLFFIGSLVAAIVGYQSYMRLLDEHPK
ncbi:hypothetical protein [Cytobacillus purgationiresistens]|uniref:Uncharacterized protein n=1 Tax=Cytobacillus purgationiresistens TaxID=863449 RepID=A0ABU0AHS2_9BACI|nr:hypothetical protein [Cytobacillus purgationiresistens]MDQ0270808.1 hypothetical protein [Cytobacillus purgationiresistens]